MSKEVVYNVTIPDNSPLIKFQPATTNAFTDTDPASGWKTESSLGETLAAGGTIVGKGKPRRVTQLNGASATFVFNGSAIFIQGQVTPGMNFDVTVDGVLSPPSSPNAVDHMLAAVTGLARDAAHTVVLTARPTDATAQLNLESFTFTHNTGFVGSSVLNQTLQDTDGSIEYSPGFLPRVEDRLPEVPHIHETSVAGNWAALTFRGRAIEVLGLTNQQNAQFSVNLDGNTTNYSSASRILAPTILYHHDGLDLNSTHTINITSLDNNPFQFSGFRVLNLDGGRLFIPSQDDAIPNFLPMIIGASAAGTLLILGVIGGLFWWFRRKKQMAASSAGRNRGQDLVTPSMEEKLIGADQPLGRGTAPSSHKQNSSVESWSVPDGTRFIHAGPRTPGAFGSPPNPSRMNEGTTTPIYATFATTNNRALPPDGLTSPVYGLQGPRFNAPPSPAVGRLDNNALRFKSALASPLPPNSVLPSPAIPPSMTMAPTPRSEDIPSQQFPSSPVSIDYQIVTPAYALTRDRDYPSTASVLAAAAATAGPTPGVGLKPKNSMGGRSIADSMPRRSIVDPRGSIAETLPRRPSPALSRTPSDSSDSHERSTAPLNINARGRLDFPPPPGSQPFARGTSLFVGSPDNSYVGSDLRRQDSDIASSTLRREDSDLIPPTRGPRRQDSDQASTVQTRHDSDLSTVMRRQDTSDLFAGPPSYASDNPFGNDGATSLSRQNSDIAERQADLLLALSTDAPALSDSSRRNTPNPYAYEDEVRAPPARFYGR